MLAKLSIRIKITAVVAFLLLALTGMGLLAVKDMRAINANTVDIATNWLVASRALGDLRTSVGSYRIVKREHMLAETIPEKDAAERNLARVLEDNAKARRVYETADCVSRRTRALRRMGPAVGRLQEGHRRGHRAVASGRRQDSP